MKKVEKFWLIITAVLVSVVLIFVAVMSKHEWDFSKLSKHEYITNTKKIAKDFSSISIDSNANITFKLANDKKCKVECLEDEKEKHFVSVQDDTLFIKTINEKSWYDYIGFNFNSPKLTVYLPKTQYTSLFINGSTEDIDISKDYKFENASISLSTGNVEFFANTSKEIMIETTTGNIEFSTSNSKNAKITTTTGDMHFKNAVANNLEISTDTGTATLNNIKCKSLKSHGDTGDIYLSNVIATDKFVIENDTGDVYFENSDAAEIFVDTDTGDVTGSLASDKVFIVRTDTGSIDVPKTITGGRCEITTDTGDIRMNTK